MPDLMTQHHSWCASNDHWTHKIQGTNDIHTVTYGCVHGRACNYSHGYSCSCKAFQFKPNQECKHIKLAKPHHCQWNQEAVMGSSAPRPPDNQCPNCHGPLSVVAIAV